MSFGHVLGFWACFYAALSRSNPWVSKSRVRSSSCERAITLPPVAGVVLICGGVRPSFHDSSEGKHLSRRKIENGRIVGGINFEEGACETIVVR